jgi:L-alanine-DL-glutamate epimerase-like enolase superfamily enzyme
MRTRDGVTADCIGHTRRSPVDVAIADVLGPRLLGGDALDTGARLADMAAATLATDEDGVLGRARSLLNTCLWDLKAQMLGLPLWRLLGGAPRPLPVALVEGYAIEGESEADLIARLLGRAAEGFRLLKVEAAHYGDPEPVRRILSAVRAEAEVQFSCDLAWSWRTAREGIEAARKWEGLGIAWIEDPMPRNRFSEMAVLRRHAPIPIGVGDEVTRPEDLHRLMDEGCVDLVRIDATTIGGPSVAVPLAATAAGRGFRTSFHVNPEVHRHCAFADSSADHIEMFPTDRPFDCSHFLIEEPAFADIRDGMLMPPERAGTGLRLNSDALVRFAYRYAVQRLP